MFGRLLWFLSILIIASAMSFAITRNVQTLAQGPPAKSAPAADEWGDDFNGSDLDQTKWERFTFEGGNGGTVKLENGQLRIRSVGGARSGVRSKQEFKGDHFVINATLAKVGPALPEPGQASAPLGNAIVTVLFDGSGRNRIEWILTSENMFEAWAVVDGRAERLDNRNMATKVNSPTLSIARRGNEYLFALNGQVGLQKTIKDLPRTFHVMLYGYGSSENNWESVQVLIPKKS
jgi:hypothetical protein